MSVDKIKEYLVNNGYTLTMEEHKSYGSYYTAKKKFKTEIEVNISNVKGTSNIYVNIRDKHYAGNCNGHVDEIEDISPIVKFMTDDKK